MLRLLLVLVGLVAVGFAYLTWANPANQTISFGVALVGALALFSGSLGIATRVVGSLVGIAFIGVGLFYYTSVGVDPFSAVPAAIGIVMLIAALASGKSVPDDEESGDYYRGDRSRPYRPVR